MTVTADDIVDILTPIFGKEIATTAVIMQCRKIAIITDELTQNNIDEFADRFFTTLQIFAGKEIAQSLVQKMKGLE